jgi:PEGA domain/Tetratricopeptide repeat
MTKTRLLALAAALTLTAPGLPTFAQQPSSKAAQQEAFSRFNKGKELYDENDFHAALIEFRRAYEIAPNYVVLYNIGNVYYAIQDYPNALTYLERYLSEGGKNIPKQKRTEVERDVEKLRSRVSNLDITVSVEGADIAVDDQIVGKSPLPKPILVGPGRHRISVSKSGYNTISRSVEVASSETPKLPFELTEQAQATPEPNPATPKEAGPVGTSTPTPAPPVGPPPHRRPQQVAVWPGWALTSGLAVSAGVVGGLAFANLNSFAAMRKTLLVVPGKTSAMMAADNLDATAARAKTFAIVADICTGAAVVAGGVSLVLTLRNLSIDRAAKQPPPAAAPSSTASRPDLAVGLGSSGVHLFGTF